MSIRRRASGIAATRRRPAVSAASVGRDCVLFDDAEGRFWQVAFDEIGSIPRVGEEVRLPNPTGATKHRYSVLSVAYEFIERGLPEEARGFPAGAGEKLTCARLCNVFIRTAKLKAAKRPE